MNPSFYLLIYVAIFLPLLSVYIQQQQQKKYMIKKIINKKRGEKDCQMEELARELIGKRCLVYTFNSQEVGVVEEVGNGALVIINYGAKLIINIDFIIKIKEYPVSKKKND